MKTSQIAKSYNLIGRNIFYAHLYTEAYSTPSVR
jgi:hypothetical protein